QGKTYFVSRHSGAVTWAEEEGFHVDEQLTHLDISLIKKGDTVIGSLPVHLVADVCRKDARYLHLSLNLSAELRGKELSPQDMRDCGARLEAYQVEKS
ncbi:MAG: CRISPR-associated protein Csx16, partial [Mariprofundaceae bacterium]|nr:CRISPR-associated protein Csx16 [Mariprofundaceae bacterium]